MSNIPNTLPKPTASGARSAPINNQTYLARFTKGEIGNSNAGNLQLTARVEVLLPESVPSAEDPNLTVKAAGATTTSYFSLDPSNEDRYADTYNAFERLQLLDSQGSVNPQAIVAAMNTGGVCFEIILGAELDVVRLPRKAGEKVGAPMLDSNGKEINRGYKVRNPFPADYLGRRPTISGLPEVPAIV